MKKKYPQVNSFEVLSTFDLRLTLLKRFCSLDEI